MTLPIKLSAFATVSAVLFLAGGERGGSSNNNIVGSTVALVMAARTVTTSQRSRRGSSSSASMSTSTSRQPPSSSGASSTTVSSRLSPSSRRVLQSVDFSNEFRQKDSKEDAELPPTPFPTEARPTPFPTERAPTPFPTEPAPTEFPTEPAPTEFPTGSDDTTLAPVVSPTLAPVVLPTSSPTDPTTNLVGSTAAPTFLSPSSSPTTFPTFDLRQTSVASDGLLHNTTCTFVPSVGVQMTSSLNLQYKIYFSDDDTSMVANDYDATLALVAHLETQLHDVLVDVAMPCDLYVNATYAMVGLTTGMPDAVQDFCDLASGGTTPPTAVVCREVVAPLNLTLWYLPAIRHYHQRQRQLQGIPPDALSQLTVWLKLAFESLTVTTAAQDAGVAQIVFDGYLNIDNVGGGLQLPEGQVASKDSTDALNDSVLTQSNANQNAGFVWGSYGIPVLVVGMAVLSVIVIFFVRQRRRNHKAYEQHVKEVDNLKLDTQDEMDVYATQIVDDESLFVGGTHAQEEGSDDVDNNEPYRYHNQRSLPSEYAVQLEDANHDYRTCASPTCRLCLQKPHPTFVHAEQKDFERHLSDLKPEKYRGGML